MALQPLAIGYSVSFFTTVGCEVLDRQTFRTHTQARTAIVASLEGLSTTHRRHSAVGYLPPVGFERVFNQEIAA